jgi:hypothetical protein
MRKLIAYYVQNVRECQMYIINLNLLDDQLCLQTQSNHGKHNVTSGSYKMLAKQLFVTHTDKI